MSWYFNVYVKILSHMNPIWPLFIKSLCSSLPCQSWATLSSCKHQKAYVCWGWQQGLFSEHVLHPKKMQWLTLCVIKEHMLAFTWLLCERKLVGVGKGPNFGLKKRTSATSDSSIWLLSWCTDGWQLLVRLNHAACHLLWQHLMRKIDKRIQGILGALCE